MPITVTKEKLISGNNEGKVLNDYAEFLVSLRMKGIIDDDIIAFPMKYPDQNYYAMYVYYPEEKKDDN